MDAAVSETVTAVAMVRGADLALVERARVGQVDRVGVLAEGQQVHAAARAVLHRAAGPDPRAQARHCLHARAQTYKRIFELHTQHALGEYSTSMLPGMFLGEKRHDNITLHFEHNRAPLPAATT